jgi:hypothetical protein
VIHRAHDDEWSTCFFSFLDREIPTSQRRGTTLHERHNSNKKLPSLAFFFLPITLRSTHFSQEHHDTGRHARSYHDTRGAAQIRLASIQEISAGLLLLFSKERRDNKRRLCPDHTNNLFPFSWLLSYLQSRKLTTHTTITTTTPRHQESHELRFTGCRE